MQSSLRLPVMCNVWYFCQFSEFPPGGNWYGRPFGFGQLAVIAITRRNGHEAGARSCCQA
jgi:hypothetical protein